MGIAVQLLTRNPKIYEESSGKYIGLMGINPVCSIFMLRNPKINKGLIGAFGSTVFQHSASVLIVPPRPCLAHLVTADRKSLG